MKSFALSLLVASAVAFCGAQNFQYGTKTDPYGALDAQDSFLSGKASMNGRSQITRQYDSFQRPGHQSAQQALSRSDYEGDSFKALDNGYLHGKAAQKS